MEEILLSDSLYIKVCDVGARLKIKNIEKKDILVGHYFHTTTCGCCPDNDGLVRYKITDTGKNVLWQLKGDMPDTCCGFEEAVAIQVIDQVGAVLGMYKGSEGSYTVHTQSGDQLYKLEKGFFSSTYEITSTTNSHKMGEISKEFTFTNLVSHLKLPPGLSLQHRVLLLAVALEVTTGYYEQQKRS